MLAFEWSKTVRAVRLSSALIITFFITWYCEVPEGLWALITCCVVLYEYTTFGGVLTKSFLRFLGTILSSLFALIIIYCFANNPVINLIFLVIGIFINAYVFLDTSKSYTSVLGCITLLITFVNYNDLSTAILRTCNVLLGESICLFTFYFVFPEYARDKVVDIQTNILTQFIDILKKLLKQEASLSEIKIDYLLYEKDFLQSVTSFNRYITEAIIEVKHVSVVIDEHRKAMIHLKHIYYLMSTFFYYMNAEKNRKTLVVTHALQSMIQHLQSIQLLLQIPIKEKKSDCMIDEQLILEGQKLPIFEALLKDLGREFRGLKEACEKISIIRAHHYKKLPADIYA